MLLDRTLEDFKKIDLDVLVRLNLEHNVVVRIAPPGFCTICSIE